jgi:hypothetical protein
MYIRNKFFHNPFEKHIAKLQDMANQITNRKTTGGMDIEEEISDEDAMRLEVAVRFINAAIENLRNLDKTK